MECKFAYPLKGLNPETYPQYKEMPLPNSEMPGLSVFLKVGDQVCHTYSSYARGLDHLLPTHALLDLTPLGRQDKEGGNPTGWMLHDEYSGNKK